MGVCIFVSGVDYIVMDNEAAVRGNMVEIDNTHVGPIALNIFTVLKIREKRENVSNFVMGRLASSGVIASNTSPGLTYSVVN